MYTLPHLLAPLRLDRWQQAECWPGAIIDGIAHYPSTPPRLLYSPIDRQEHGQLLPASAVEVSAAVGCAIVAFEAWRTVPAPRRGELVRRIGEAVRLHKTQLAQLITLEAGKIASEAEGEVQEWIDVCDYAAGLSRQLHGLTIASERPQHRLLEQWHPLGVVGVISAFNFPVAVWAWNAMLALVCGDAVVWKPSEKTPLCALAATALVLDVLRDFGDAPAGLIQLVQGDAVVGDHLASDRHIALISATGSVAMGRAVAQHAATRLGRSLLELGGNNAAIITASADLELAARAIVFAAAGTCGQRCTSLRRLFVHEEIADALQEKLITAYQHLNVGDPRFATTLIGPLIDDAAMKRMHAALAQAEIEGGRILIGGGQVRVGGNVPDGGCYVRPALLAMPEQTDVVHDETFAPVLYLMRYARLNEAIALNNAVSQGLSSAIFTTDLREAGAFIGPAGSDCGLANVNAGTSGAEIGGAFGGEKDTGGGRESGSDAWKNYMRRATNTLNDGHALPLAQGVRFG
ncbi:aldehyde dehydrogenase family protein [Jeongeupia naejangsanensis]|uniref:aldehyde dehydrogenase (NAD(+)) n=1 Tax=Jeongeupia naejangsanensis TaxID=613195 RepID=A0ABS2BGJ9_9NEIS|nr:aldehyde dehydrogenase family protein [Jeongeupia naejangsanensis]MBM3114742.1 aldehyde dehydrogenase family protein [Jeongeupia naejangsanensis]